MTLEEEAVDYIPGRSYLLKEKHGRFSIKKWLRTLPRYILAHFCTLINATKTTILLKYQGMCKVLVVDGLPAHGAASSPRVHERRAPGDFAVLLSVPLFGMPNGRAQKIERWVGPWPLPSVAVATNQVSALAVGEDAECIYLSD
jgi:hypothetical protein